MVTRLHLPRAAEARSYAYEINVVILTPEMEDLIGMIIQDEAMNVARSVPQGAHYLADFIYLPSLYHWKGTKKVGVLRVRPTPTRLLAISGQCILAF